MNIADFDFALPKELIAQYPLHDRTASRLLVLHKDTGEIEHCFFRDLPKFLNSADLIVANDTKVMKARLFGNKATGGKVEVFLEKILAPNEALALLRSNKGIKDESSVFVEGKTEKYEIFVRCHENGLFRIFLKTPNKSFYEIAEECGNVPLPPYIDRKAENDDESEYQTVYAKNLGAVAAPTAGLHFDEKMINDLKQKLDFQYLTLHVGAGTFLPIKTDEVEKHMMHSEFYELSPETASHIKRCQNIQGRVVAVGTTVVRTLESIYASEHEIKAKKGITNIFIYPGFQFHVVDALITNFHLPKSTLLLLVSAFAGKEKIMKAYMEAISQKYRFFSYGDAMLII